MRALLLLCGLASGACYVRPEGPVASDEVTCTPVNFYSDPIPCVPWGALDQGTANVTPLQNGLAFSITSGVAGCRAVQTEVVDGGVEIEIDDALTGDTAVLFKLSNMNPAIGGEFGMKRDGPMLHTFVNVASPQNGISFSTTTMRRWRLSTTDSSFRAEYRANAAEPWNALGVPVALAEPPGAVTVSFDVRVTSGGGVVGFKNLAVCE